jgi:hypothetical protein
MISHLSLFSIENLFYAIVGIGTVIIIFNLVYTIILRPTIPGGFTGKWLEILWFCMFLFILSEGSGAFFFMTHKGGIYLSYFLISLGVLAAAVFIAVANRFIYNLIKELEKRI